jgi:hypothetical protein
MIVEAQILLQHDFLQVLSPANHQSTTFLMNLSLPMTFHIRTSASLIRSLVFILDFNSDTTFCLLRVTTLLRATIVNTEYCKQNEVITSVKKGYWLRAPTGLKLKTDNLPTLC